MVLRKNACTCKKNGDRQVSEPKNKGGTPTAKANFQKKRNKNPKSTAVYFCNFALSDCRVLEFCARIMCMFFHLIPLIRRLDFLLVRGHESVSRLRSVLGLGVVHLEEQAALVGGEVSRLGDLVAGASDLDHVSRLNCDRSGTATHGKAKGGRAVRVYPQKERENNKQEMYRQYNI